MQLSGDRKIATEMSIRKDPIRCSRFGFATEQIVAFRMANAKGEADSIVDQLQENPTIAATEWV
jgi:hypothetical protein